MNQHQQVNKTSKQVSPQRQVAPSRQVSVSRKATPKHQVAPYRQVAFRPQVAQRAHVAPQQRYQQQTPSQSYRPTQPNHSMGSGMPRISSTEVRRIGDQIFQNESGGDVNKLIHWNKGENFASMGIGHFTWYPAGRKQSFGNTFPGMLTYLESRGVRLPQWIKHAKRSGAPWRTRSQLLRDKHNPQVQQLQRILFETRYLQAEYIMQRAQRAMPKLVTTAPPHLRPRVASNLNAVANSRGGW
jgi:hypothetical protein